MGVIRVMDYGVLLLSRIQEEYRRWPDNARAVSAGLQHTGGLITAAAAIMAAVFVSFALADLVVIKAIARHGSRGRAGCHRGASRTP